MITITARSLVTWTYRDQKAHWYLASPYDWFIWGLAESGADPDAPRATVDHDAAMCHQAVTLLPKDDAEALVWHASLGDWPERCQDEPRPLPTAVDRTTRSQRLDGTYGRATIDGRLTDYLIATAGRTSWEEPVYENQGNRKTGKKLVQVGTETKSEDIPYCPLHWEPDPTWLSHHNALCDALDRSLAAITTMFRDQPILKRHEVVDEPTADPVPMFTAIDLCAPRWTAARAAYAEDRDRKPYAKWDEQQGRHINLVRVGSARLERAS